MKLAIVGVRHAHIRSVINYAKSTGRFDIVAVVESDDELRDGTARELGVSSYRTLDELLNDRAVDAAALAPVNSERAVTAATCLEAGIHVIVDKPLATRIEDLEALADVVKEGRSVLSLMLTLRFNPAYATARQLIREGAIGRLVHAWMCRPHKLNRPGRPGWMFSRSTYGGIIPDLAIHDLDVFRWVTGADSAQIEHLTALHGNSSVPDAPEFEDVGHVLLRLRDGTVGSFEASWLTPNAAPYHGDCRAIFTGTEGTIEVLSVQKKVIVTNASHVGHEAPLVSCDRVEDDFLRGIAEGVDRMVLPPQEALESTRWSLMARDVADEIARGAHA